MKMCSSISSTVKSELMQFISMILYCVTLGKVLNLSGLFTKGVRQMVSYLFLGPGHHEFPAYPTSRSTWAGWTSGSPALSSFAIYPAPSRARGSAMVRFGWIVASPSSTGVFPEGGQLLPAQLDSRSVGYGGAGTAP